MTNRYFNQKLTPSLFQNVSCKGGQRHENLVALSETPTLTRSIRTLRIEVSPKDFGPVWSDEIHGYPAGDRAHYFFDDLKRYLIPSLSRMSELHHLYVTTSYYGLYLAGISREKLLMPCFETLCTIIREAQLGRLETVQVGVPYEGGYAGFFQDEACRRAIEGLKGPRLNLKDGFRELTTSKLTKASVKLSDWHDNYTIMDFNIGV